MTVVMSTRLAGDMDGDARRGTVPGQVTLIGFYQPLHPLRAQVGLSIADIYIDDRQIVSGEVGTGYGGRQGCYDLPYSGLILRQLTAIGGLDKCGYAGGLLRPVLP